MISPGAFQIFSPPPTDSPGEQFDSCPFNKIFHFGYSISSFIHLIPRNRYPWTKLSPVHKALEASQASFFPLLASKSRYELPSFSSS